MKKIVALALCLVMVLGLMSGCQKPMDLETLIKKMEDAGKSVTATGMDAGMEMDMEVSVLGTTMTMGMGMEMKVRTKSDLSAMYMDMKMAMEAMGESEETNMEIYGVMEDGVMTSYAYEKKAGIWVRTTQEDYSDLIIQFSGMQNSLSQMPIEQMKLAEEKVTVNDRECYQLTVDMDGELFQSHMSDYMGTIMSQITGSGELDEEGLAMMAQMDWTALRTSCVYHVDAETFRPLEMTMEIKGMGDVLNDLLVSMMGMQTGDLEFTIDVPTVKMVTKNMVYNEAVEIPALPQEAVENAIDADSLDETMNEELVDTDDGTLANPPQDDGSYLITLGGDVVRVMVPEGYPTMDSGTDYVVGIAEDGYNSVYYMLYNDMTSEDVVTMFNEEVVWAKDNGWYGSHTEPTELEGYTTMGLIYNDDTSTWYAWRELKDSILLLGTDYDAVDFDLTTLFATVEIIG